MLNLYKYTLLDILLLVRGCYILDLYQLLNLNYIQKHWVTCKKETFKTYRVYFERIVFKIIIYILYNYLNIKNNLNFFNKNKIYLKIYITRPHPPRTQTQTPHTHPSSPHPPRAHHLNSCNTFVASSKSFCALILI